MLQFGLRLFSLFCLFLNFAPHRYFDYDDGPPIAEVGGTQETKIQKENMVLQKIQSKRLLMLAENAQKGISFMKTIFNRQASSRCVNIVTLVVASFHLVLIIAGVPAVTNVGNDGSLTVRLLFSAGFCA